MTSTKNAFKDFLVPIKCVVTRIDDPAQLNRVQVYIPSMHGELDEESKGIGDRPGLYPWAQLCTTLFKDNNNATISSLQELFAGNVPVILPPVGTVGWVLFEGGDMRTPIYMGSLSKGEANEYVTSVYSGSDGNNLTIGIGGSSQLDIMKNIIFGHESGGAYDNINPKDVDAISIGLLQWHADRARNLLIDIRNANPGDFNAKCIAFGSNFQNKLSASWSLYYVNKILDEDTHEVIGDQNYLAIKAILGTSYSKDCQDNLVRSDLAEYQKVAVSLGITSFDAQIYFCDMYNQSPTGATNIANATVNKSLDALHETCLNGGYWLGENNQYNNRGRRISVYNEIKLLASNGGLNPTDSTNLNGNQSLGLFLKYPTESKDIAETYDNDHKYIVIASDPGIDVIAPMGGNAYFGQKSSVDGWYVEITNGKYIIRLCNLANNIEGHETTKDVQAGDVIGQVGYSSTWQPCLIVKFKINGVPTDPVPYFTDSSTGILGTTSGTVETAVNWMINIANDDSHGYSQTARYGPDYDCTSLCTHGYINAGLPIDPKTWTANMKSNFESVGFVALPYNTNMTLIRGDVLLVHASDHQHAVCYIGNGQIVSAHQSETSGREGKAGDQTQHEIDVSSFSNYSKGTNWQYVLRYNG